MNDVIVFTKLFKNWGASELVAFAHRTGLDGLDLCVRPGYEINPQNAPERLKDFSRAMAGEGLSIPMVTGSLDLLWPDDPVVAPLLRAMDQSNIRLLKLGYYFWDPFKQDYWEEVDRIRRGFEGWAALSKQYGVKICYHTHSVRCMGMNAAALMHLIDGFDPDCIGAFIDPVHLVIEGEEFAIGANMLRRYLCVASVKDIVLHQRSMDGHNEIQHEIVSCGTGMVNFDNVFTALRHFNFHGPLTVHCEFEQARGEEFTRLAEQDVRYALQLRGQYLM